MLQSRSVMVKILLSISLVGALFLVVPATIHIFAAPNVEIRKLFGAKKLFKPAKNIPRITGVHAYMTTPDTPMPIGAQKTGAPVGITNWGGDGTFAESGPLKTCPLLCEYHVYSSYWDGNTGGQVTEAWTNLLPNGTYEYKTYGLGNNMFRIEFCDGTGCWVLRDVNLGKNAVKYAFAGGEGISADYGPVTTTAFQYRNNRQLWFFTCYTDILNVPANTGVITPCGGNFDWTVHFP